VPEEYLRDGRSPVPARESISKSMRSNKGKNTSPEIALRKALRENGASGYRLHWNVPGRPDIAYPGRKVAIFVNGCFWHRCPTCALSMPKSNTDFWTKKFERNVARDAEKRRLLEDSGWMVITVWECGIHKDIKTVTDTVLIHLRIS
jgi:DNA mismatch endonuclease (patch repair protein)